jgi:hypothetical protein
MLPNQRKAILCGLLLVLIATLLPAIKPVQAVGQLTDPTPLPQLYLPLITKPPVYLHGKITDKGVPVANQSFTLYMFVAGNPPVIVPTTATDENGDYRVELPFLATGQGVQLNWRNTVENESWLSSYICDAIAENPPDDVNCSFDIENINLSVTTPYITLPYTFSWTKRSTPSDTYFFKMHRLNFGNPFYTSASLGYVDSYLLEGLPDGYETNTPYEWYILVCNTGGCGFSYHYQDIIFADGITFPP